MLRAQTEQSLIGSAGGIQTPELDARLYEQKRNLDTLLQRYTDEHPDVVNTRRLIAELEAQKRREIDELRRKAKAAPGGPAVEANPAVLSSIAFILQLKFKWRHCARASLNMSRVPTVCRNNSRWPCAWRWSWRS